jgi:hypothetical protein
VAACDVLLVALVSMKPLMKPLLINGHREAQTILSRTLGWAKVRLSIMEFHVTTARD